LREEVPEKRFQRRGSREEEKRFQEKRLEKRFGEEVPAEW
jgi:hypothetical protein